MSTSHHSPIFAKWWLPPLGLLRSREYAPWRPPEVCVAATALSTSCLKAARAYQLRVEFQKVWQSSKQFAALHLQIWYSWAIRSQIPDMVKAAKTIRQHAVGILQWFACRMTNGLIEAINGLIQAAKREARGYRTMSNLIAMIYFIGATLAP